MEIIKAENLTFFYPYESLPALKDVSFSVNKGDFITICGKSGCGKSTLLTLLKPILSPNGVKEGKVLFEGKDVTDLSDKEQCLKIGFVMQNPDSQIVTDTVWHELAFGLESLGVPSEQIRLRVSEMASYFGIEQLFNKNVNELSGGQKQLLNLASVMATNPSVLILDEPTSQLDPISAANFLDTLHKLNYDMGTTIILSEHRLEEVFPLSDKVMVMEDGFVIAYASPGEVGNILNNTNSTMFFALPTPMQVHYSVPNNLTCPVTVREGKKWMSAITRENKVTPILSSDNFTSYSDDAVILKDVFFRYEKDTPDVMKGVSLKVKKGEIYSLVGGNGTGKTTTLSVISGLLSPYRGKVKTKGIVGFLPQDPQLLFTKNTIAEDLKAEGASEENLNEAISLCLLENLLHRHPYDLSGGEIQRAALCKILLSDPDIILLDEPTKGIDAHFKDTLSQIFKSLANKGKTIILVSHDIEFCAEIAHRTGLFFDGTIVSDATPRDVFGGNNFYTTAANRMARDYIPNVILKEDIILSLGSTPKEKPPAKSKPHSGEKKSQMPVHKDKKQKFLWLFSLIPIILVPLTILFGIYFFEDRKYYFISMLIILEIILPFLISFEKKKPKEGEIVIISVLCAICVTGRTAFYMLPQFKPLIALIIISSVALGAHKGFLIGAITAFVSNFLFGQGPWTPWQMFALGLIGFVSGLVFSRVSKNRFTLCLFGAFATLVIFGGIMNPASALINNPYPSLELFITYYISGLPMDIIHMLSTVFFLFVLSKPMLEKLDRIKIKYNI